MKSKNIILGAFALIAVSFLLVTMFALGSLDTLMDTNNREMTTILASQIYDELNNELLTPIMVAQTMSYDYALQQMLEQQADFPHDEPSRIAVEAFLNDICEGFGYNSAFVISDKSRAYYSQKGVNKIISPETDAHDVWYPLFVNSGLKYDFDVDTDEVHDNQWTVFVNCRIENGDQEFLGVCGVGVKMTFLQSMLSEYEEKYGVKINLIDSNGLVQVDTDSVNIESAVLENAVAIFDENAEYTYKEMPGGGFTITKYVESFDWYLVIANEEVANRDVYSHFLDCVFVAFTIEVVLLFILLHFVLKRDQRRLEISARLDVMTGLLNKKAMIDATEQALQSRAYQTAAFLLLDMDHFKAVNDCLGHVAGDQAIRDAAEKLKDIFRKEDIVGRFGGDEFCIFLKDVPEDVLQARLDELCRRLRHEYTNGKITVQVAVSIGAVYVSRECALDYHGLMQTADEALYEAKKQGRDCYVVRRMPA